MVPKNALLLPLYLPRILRLWRNWLRYLINYVLRRSTPAEYHLRDGVRIIDGRGTMPGTLAVVFVRREYGVLGRCRTIVDVGANMGSFAIYAARSCPEATIYCFEPESRNYRLLRQNIGINNFGDRIQAFPLAVAGAPGLRSLALGDSLTNSFHIHPCGASSETVHCTTLRDILGQPGVENIDLLKINCEGAEYEILESCSEAEFGRIANIRLEYHNLDVKRRNGKALSELLISKGYQIHRFTRYRASSGFIWASRMGLLSTVVSLLLDVA
jgi:FkbM family methyltransferase